MSFLFFSAKDRAVSAVVLILSKLFLEIFKFFIKIIVNRLYLLLYLAEMVIQNVNENSTPVTCFG